MEKDYMKLLVKDSFILENDIYCVSSECNLFFKQNIHSKKIEILGSLPEKKSIEKNIIGGLCIYKNEIYFAPHSMNNIWIYNLVTKEWLVIEREELPHTSSGGILQVFEYNDYVYMVGAHYPAILIIDPETKEVKYITEPFNEKGDSTQISDIYFRAQHVINGEYLFLPSGLDNTILKLNLKNHEYEWVNVGGRDNRFSGITYDGTYYWLSPRHNSSIIRWDGGKKADEIVLPSYFSCRECFFCGIVKKDNGILVCNMYSDKSLYIDKQTLQVDIVDNQYSMVKEMDGYSITQTTNGEIKIYIEDKCIHECFLKINREEIYNFFSDNNFSILKKGEYFYEKEIFSLDGFLGFISGGDK